MIIIDNGVANTDNNEKRLEKSLNAEKQNFFSHHSSLLLYNNFNPCWNCTHAVYDKME